MEEERKKEEDRKKDDKKKDDGKKPSSKGGARGDDLSSLERRISIIEKNVNRLIQSMKETGDAVESGRHMKITDYDVAFIDDMARSFLSRWRGKSQHKMESLHVFMKGWVDVSRTQVSRDVLDAVMEFLGIENEVKENGKKENKPG